MFLPLAKALVGSEKEDVVEILHEAPPVYCQGCNLVIAPGTKFVVKVGDYRFHDECWEKEKQASRGCVGCGSHH